MGLKLILLLFSFQFAALLDQAYSSAAVVVQKLQLPGEAQGPEGIAFDRRGGGPYVSVRDGRILKYDGARRGFIDFATTSPNRTKALCDGAYKPNLKSTCGFPLGIRFDPIRGNLYIADVVNGLLVVGEGGGPATQLAAGIDGNRFNFTNALALDPHTQIVYFVDSGAIFNSGNLTQIILSGDKSSKLYRYNPRETRKVTELYSGLSGATGIALSTDESFVLVSEYIGYRITRFWLKGPRTNSSEIFVRLPGNPDNIMRTNRGDFWVSCTVDRLLHPNATSFAFGVRISQRGRVLETRNLSPPLKVITEVHEYKNELYIGHLFDNFVGVVKR